jgi:hypothetical protein
VAPDFLARVRQGDALDLVKLSHGTFLIQRKIPPASPKVLFHRVTAS